MRSGHCLNRVFYGQSATDPSEAGRVHTDTLQPHLLCFRSWPFDQCLCRRFDEWQSRITPEPRHGGVIGHLQQVVALTGRELGQRGFRTRGREREQQTISSFLRTAIEGFDIESNAGGDAASSMLIGGPPGTGK